MASNKGLGRGYAALLGLNDIGVDDAPQDKKALFDIESVKSGDVVLPIAVDEIDPNFEQPRKNFDQEALDELAESIKMHGVIQPIVVTPVGTRYMIIAGERRWRASKQVGKKEIPAIVRNYTPQQIKEISLIENLQREDLNPVETARAIKTLMTEFSMTQESVADRIGKSRSNIANLLRLLSLDSAVIELIEKGRLSAGHARALVVIPQQDQYRLALKVCDNQLNVRGVEKLVKDYLNPKTPADKNKESCLELKELVTNMQRTFATKVSAMGNDKKGRICIDYFSKDDLDRICELVQEWMKKSFNSENE